VSKTGFIGELAILYATNLDLITCWMGHYVLSEIESLMPHLGEYKSDNNPKYGYGKGIVEGRRVICASPVGYWKQKGLRLFDRMQVRNFSYNRKHIEDLIDGNVEVGSISRDIKYAIELASKAPSALNKQFWRFKVSADQKEMGASKC